MNTYWLDDIHQKRFFWMTLLLVFGLGATPAAAQNDAKSEIEKAGGRVWRISMDSEDLEVSFHLSDHAIGDQHIQRLHELGNVVWLNLKGTDITNEGLAAVAKLTNLKKLHLELTKIDDGGLQHLLELNDLEYLNLYGTNVTDAGLEQLVKLKGLKKLYLWQSKVSDEAIVAFASKRPDVKAIGEVKMPVVEEPSPADEKKESGADEETSAEKKDVEKDKEKKDVEDKKKKDDNTGDDNTGDDNTGDERDKRPGPGNNP